MIILSIFFNFFYINKLLKRKISKNIKLQKRLNHIYSYLLFIKFTKSHRKI
jgi:hypothetical protein